jgi:hypothetical protein
VPRWLVLVFAGVGTLLFGLTVFSSSMLALVGLFGGPTLIAAGILYRPREVRSRQRRGALDGLGAGWGDGIGPVPGQPGPVIAREALPARLTRRYTGYSREFVGELEVADGGLLAARGYRRVSSEYVEGKWRGVDWAAAAFLLLFFFLFGVLALIYLAATKPVGTQVATYELIGTSASIGEARPVLAAAAG